MVQTAKIPDKLYEECSPDPTGAEDDELAKKTLDEQSKKLAAHFKSMESRPETKVCSLRHLCRAPSHPRVRAPPLGPRQPIPARVRRVRSTP